MSSVQCYANVMFCMMIGVQSVTFVWFCLQPDWKPVRPWEREGWFQSFSDELAASTFTALRPKERGSRFDGSPEFLERRTALSAMLKL
jgi:hypothetical protein